MSNKLKPFYLQRNEDVNGKSGTGVVAVGCVFPNGKVVFHWLTYRSSVVIFESVEDMIEIHGHEGRTVVVMGDPPEEKTALDLLPERIVEQGLKNLKEAARQYREDLASGKIVVDKNGKISFPEKKRKKKVTE